jgi:hypothetical protein
MLKPAVHAYDALSQIKVTRRNRRATHLSVSLSARPNSLRVWNVDLNNPLEFARYATARVTFVEGSAARFAVISLHRKVVSDSALEIPREFRAW